MSRNKRFTLIFTMDQFNVVSTQFKNEGFMYYDVIGMLEITKTELIKMSHKTATKIKNQNESK